MHELSSHCLCDKCSGDDCKAVEEFAPETTRKKERDKVLDELKYWITELPKIRTRRIPTDEETEWVGYFVVMELIDAARQKAGEP